MAAEAEPAAGKQIVDELLVEIGQIGLTANTIQELEASDTIVTNVIKNAHSLAVPTQHPNNPFIENVRAFGQMRCSAGADQVGQALISCANASMKLSEIQTNFNVMLEQTLQMPFTVIGSAAKAAELRANLETSTKHYDKLRSKAKGSSDKKLATMDTQAAVLCNATCDYAQQLSVVMEKRNVDLVQHLLSMYKMVKAQVDDMSQHLAEALPQLDTVAAQVSSDKEGIESMRKQLAALKLTHEKEVFRAERRENEVERYEREAKESRKRKGSKSNLVRSSRVLCSAFASLTCVNGRITL